MNGIVIGCGAPVYYDHMNAAISTNNPNSIHTQNTALTGYFRRYLLQKALSVFEWKLPENWNRDYFLYVLFCWGVGMTYTYKHKVMNTTFYLLPYIYRGERGVQDDDTSMFCGILNAGLFTGTAIVGISLQQTESATAAGGLTDLYNECKLLNKSLVCPIQYPSAVHAEKQVMNGNRIHHRIKYRYLSPCIIRSNDPQRDNIAWDKYPEDVPFTQEAFYKEWRQAEIRKPNNN